MQRTRFVSLLLALAMLLALLPLSVFADSASIGPGGFRAFSGDAAASYHVPDGLAITGVDSFDQYGATVERYAQRIGEAEVFGGRISVYRDSTGQAFAVIGAHYPDLIATNEVRLSEDAAERLASAQQGSRTGEWRISLMLHPDTGRYFYIVENRQFDSRWFYWIDAENGMIFNAYDGLETGSGTGVLGDTKDLTGLTTFASGVYRLQAPDNRQTTYDGKNRTTLPGTLATDADDLWNLTGRTSPGQRALVDAHFYARVTDNYYRNVHGFNWLTYYPSGMISTAHHKSNYVNAFWNGTQMAYGDGDGVSFVEMSGDLDVVAHELSHGVTSATSNLVYQNESGALNEAFSDIMGTAIEFYNGTGNWTIGEDIDIVSDGIRDMANPGADGDPSHYADRYTGTSDNGGVHTNSGIANHWFYLLTAGGQNANANRRTGNVVQGIGMAAAERVAFLGFTGLPSGATFCQARSATIAVATAADQDNVGAAWDEVGVTTALCGGGGGGGTGPTITNVTSFVTNAKRGQFAITWTTNVASTSEVTFNGIGTYTNATMVTSHRMDFTGTKGALYTYYVSSVDANGNRSTAGPFTHQN